MSYSNEHGEPYRHGHSQYEQYPTPQQYSQQQYPQPPAPPQQYPQGYGQQQYVYPPQQYYAHEKPQPVRTSRYNWVPIVGIVLAVVGMLSGGIDTAQVFANVGTEEESKAIISPLGTFGYLFTWVSIGFAIASIVMWSKRSINQKALVIANGVTAAFALMTPILVTLVSVVFFAADLFNVLRGNR